MKIVLYSIFSAIGLIAIFSYSFNNDIAMLSDYEILAYFGGCSGVNCDFGETCCGFSHVGCVPWDGGCCCLNQGAPNFRVTSSGNICNIYGSTTCYGPEGGVCEMNFIVDNNCGNLAGDDFEVWGYYCSL